MVKRLVPEGKTYCSVCSRLCQVSLNIAVGGGCTKIALGHHADDILRTSFSTSFYVGTLKTIPVLRQTISELTIIRPMAFVWERDITRFAALEEFPIIPCNLCGSQENLKRRQVGRLIEEIEVKIPGLRKSMLTALGNSVPSHLLDPKLFDFKSLAFSSGIATGDIQVELDAVPDFHQMQVIGG